WSPGSQAPCCVSPRPIPPPSLKPTPQGMVKRLQEDVTCSICLDILEDPVSIECGHNFCRGCLVAHWSGVSASGSQCPECRAPCSRGRMIPDTRGGAGPPGSDLLIRN
uniref:RING-type domain-containing protein n=1 Tax=Gopherus evgoodei TaxID=1825980 RepID=A0A8C4YAH8_9SAUR